MIGHCGHDSGFTVVRMVGIEVLHRIFDEQANLPDGIEILVIPRFDCDQTGRPLCDFGSMAAEPSTAKRPRNSTARLVSASSVGVAVSKIQQQRTRTYSEL